MTAKQWAHELLEYAQLQEQAPDLDELDPEDRALAELHGIAMVRFFHEERAQVAPVSDVDGEHILVWLTDSKGLSAARELIAPDAQDLVALSPEHFDAWLSSHPDDGQECHSVYMSFIELDHDNKDVYAMLKIAFEWGADQSYERIDRLQRTSQGWRAIESRAEVS
ncbi:MAG TPA: hypothetical protein DCQ06_00345 [Myxococcales bacterium]|nr:hypothetical protein [Myxococcales bacterium]